MLAYCGLACGQCLIYLATSEQDESRQKALKISIAEECRIHYRLNLQPEDITDCDGCRSGSGRLFSGCLNYEIRKCAILRKTESCAFCPDYICDRLKKHFLLDPEAQTRLETIRKSS